MDRNSKSFSGETQNSFNDFKLWQQQRQCQQHKKIETKICIVLWNYVIKTPHSMCMDKRYLKNVQLVLPWATRNLYMCENMQ